MKGNLFLSFLMFFILSACQPSPGGQGQTANESERLVSDTPSSPAIISDSSEASSISLDDYPISSSNFIVDSKTNEIKMDLIKSWAPEEIEKEIALYNAEFKRMKVDTKFIRYETSIVDGKSWVLYPKDIRTNEAYIVSIKGVIRPSIDLFGFLDKSTDDDFFNLVKVNIPNAQAVGDKSGWHVFAEVINGNVTQWYDATKDRINTVEVKPEAIKTPEAPQREEIRITNTVSMEDFPKFSKLSRVDLEDLTSGKLAEVERKWLEENPFPENIKPLSNIQLRDEKIEITGWYTIEHKFVYLFFPFEYHEKDSRPYKIISFYVLEDKDLFNSLSFSDESVFGSKKLGIMSWAWLNPDKSTVIVHSLINLRNANLLDGDDFFEYPGVDFNIYDEIDPSTVDEIKSIMKIYSVNPELKPLELAKEWASTKNMPKEMELKLLGGSYYTQAWE